MTTSGDPEGPGQGGSTTARRPNRSLWEQSSFLILFAWCVLLLTSGGSFLLILTVLGYAIYRRKRGWKVLPTSGWLPSRHTSRRRWIGLGLYASLLLLLAATPLRPERTGSPGAADGPWSKSMATTTCGDWLSVMSSGQRQAFAQALLSYDLSKPHGPALNQTNATEYVSVITDTCRKDSPSSLVMQ